ncbi:MAG: putative DNA-binding protein [Clostridia bacterium]|nr:putative DNA-binding protein [Clostridia bacterium]
MEEKVKISILCELYGKLLTEKQFEFLDDYYNNDLSLSEIAENNGITRQAVRDNLKKGECKLFEFEEKLGLMEKTILQEEKIAVILSELNKIKDKSSDKQVAKILEHIKSELNCLV